MPPQWSVVTSLLLLCVSCTLDPAQPEAPRQPSALELRLSDTLRELRTAYDSLHLWDALDRAQRLRVQVEATPDSLSKSLRAEVYQRLALLYYHHAHHEDSIQYYASAAAPLVSEQAPPLIRARQLLCDAYVKYTEWEWLEMDMTAALGKLVLEDASLSLHPLYAELLVAQGYARRKYADTNLSGEERKNVSQQSEVLYREAMELLGGLHSPHYFRAQERLMDYYMRLPDKDSVIAATIAQLATSPWARSVVPTMADRLAVFWHDQRDRPDSVLYYADRLLRADDPFDQIYRREAYFASGKVLIRRRDFAGALQANVRDAANVGCRPDYTRPDTGMTYAQQFHCPYYAISEAEILIARYRHLRDEADLRRAYALTQRVTRDYAATFPTYRQNGILGKLYELGINLLNVALETTAQVAIFEPTPAHLSEVLGVMELGKSFLLARDLYAARQSAQHRELANLQKQVTSLKHRYSQRFDPRPAELRQFREADRSYQRLLGLPRFEASSGSVGQMPSTRVVLADVQRRLHPREALLEMVDVPGGTLLLYVDVDTALLATVDPGVARRADTLLRLITDNADQDTIAEVGAAIYEALFGPLADLLRARTDLLIAPSASFQHLPFGSLVAATRSPATGSTRQYLMDDYVIRYLPSWRVEDFFRHQRDTFQTQHMACGIWTHPDLSPYFGRVSDYVVDYSSGSSRHFIGSSIAAGQLVGEAGEYDIIHLSVHARGNRERFQDNYLYLSETDSISTVDLLNNTLDARLVVLAACSTAQGYTFQGEGTFSLARSFHLAGVPDVICTRYDVPAAATAVLLHRFYEYLFAGEEPARALTYAQRDCRLGKLGKRYVPSFYWSGFFIG